MSKPVEVVKEESNYITDKKIPETMVKIEEDREEEIKSKKIIAETLAKKDISSLYLLEYKELYYHILTIEKKYNIQSFIVEVVNLITVPIPKLKRALLSP